MKTRTFVSMAVGLFGVLSAEAVPPAAPLDPGTLAERQKISAECVTVLAVPLDEEIFRQGLAAQADALIAKFELEGEKAEKVRRIMMDAGKKVTNESLLAMIRDAYAETYSVEQLTGILAFYKTDAGKALLARSKDCEALIERKQKAMVKAMLDESAKELKVQLPDLLKKGG